MSHTVNLNTLNASPTFPLITVGQVGVSLGTPDEPYIVESVDMRGTVIAALPLAHPGDIVDTLNAGSTFDITFPKDAYTRDDVDILGNPSTEIKVRVRLGNKVLAWGPAIGEQGGGPGVNLACAGVDAAYFPKRAIDEEPISLLLNGGFEDDLNNWTTSGGVIGVGTTSTIETDVVVEGSKAVRVVGSSAPTGLAQVSDPVTYTAGPLGATVALTFSFVLESLASAADTALFNAGLLLIGSPPGPGGAVVGGVNAVGAAVYRIDNDTPRRVVIRDSISIFIPPRKTWALQVWLFAPKTGTIVYDNLDITPLRTLTTAVYTGSPAATVDVSRIVRMLADHTLSNLHNKSHLRIGLNLPNCGVRMARSYDFVDHTYFDQAFGELVARDDCFDYDIELTKTSRTLRIFPLNAGGMGTDRSANVTLTYGQAPVASYSPTIDGGSTATQVAELGDGSGAIREERWATDASQIGGTILQATLQAPPDAPLNSLAPLARGELAARRQPPEVLEVLVTREPGGHTNPAIILQDLLGKGDSVSVDIQDGWFTYSGVWRIVRRARHCRARTMTYTLNKVSA